ncbi:MAG: type I restriction enzyme HsdR N-terminal domain-containing protein [Bacteroidetes bacterium]|nr:type I restriction enzyme HsdR N-terminal domain-containing protein [Bacteroidota bacterium]MBK9424612.1 type I restriction enzyme HsdR N-terminal domain-containing protein [Bacteroidota bacterium]
MAELNLPSYPFKIRTTGQSKEIFDSLRRKFVLLTPEEWVRQHFVEFLKNELGYPASLIAIEKGFKVNQRSKRADIVIHNRSGMPWMIVECKASHVVLTEEAFYQAASYHLKLNVSYLIITNGLQHYCCKFENGTFAFVEGFPTFNS